MKSLLILLIFAFIGFSFACDGKFCLNVKVKNVSSSSVSFHWTPNPLTRHFQQLKIKCRSEGTYSDSNGRVLMHRSSKKTRFYPLFDGYGMLTDLEPHMHYMCMLTLSRGKRYHKENVNFYSQIGAPDPPNKPRVVEHKANDNYYKIKLYSSSTLNGPISGYEIQFRLVGDSPIDNETSQFNESSIISDETKKDISQLISDENYAPFGKVPSIEEAQSSSQPTSFFIRKETSPLPENIIIDDTLLNGALKQGSSYVIVVIAYSRNEERNLLFSSSEPSTIISINSYHSRLAKFTIAVKYNLFIISGAIIMGIMVIVSGICLILRWRKTKRNAIKRERDFSRQAHLRNISPNHLPFKNQVTLQDIPASHDYATQKEKWNKYQQYMSANSQLSPRMKLLSPLSSPPSPPPPPPSLAFPDLLSEHEQQISLPPSTAKMLSLPQAPPTLLSQPPNDSSQVLSPKHSVSPEPKANRPLSLQQPNIILSDNESLTKERAQTDIPKHIKTLNMSIQIDEGIDSSSSDTMGSSTESTISIPFPVDLPNKMSSGIVIDQSLEKFSDCLSIPPNVSTGTEIASEQFSDCLSNVIDQSSEQFSDCLPNVIDQSSEQFSDCLPNVIDQSSEQFSDCLSNVPEIVIEQSSEQLFSDCLSITALSPIAPTGGTSLPYITAQSSPKPPIPQEVPPLKLEVEIESQHFLPIGRRAATRNVTVVPKSSLYRSSSVSPSLLSMASKMAAKKTDKVEERATPDRVSGKPTEPVTYVYKPGTFMKKYAANLRRHSSELFKRKSSAASCSSTACSKSMPFSSSSILVKETAIVVNPTALRRVLKGETSLETHVDKKRSFRNNDLANDSKESFHSIESQTEAANEKFYDLSYMA